MHKHTHRLVRLAINLKQAANKTLIHSLPGDVTNSFQLQLDSVSVFCTPLFSRRKFGRVTKVYSRITQSLHTNSGIEPRIWLQPLPSTPFPYHMIILYLYSKLQIATFNATYITCKLTADILSTGSVYSHMQQPSHNSRCLNRHMKPVPQ
jgi:hypothetical protein